MHEPATFYSLQIGARHIGCVTRDMRGRKGAERGGVGGGGGGGGGRGGKGRGGAAGGEEEERRVC